MNLKKIEYSYKHSIKDKKRHFFEKCRENIHTR